MNAFFVIMSITQTQKKHSDKYAGKKIKKWDVIKQDRLKKLDSMTDTQLEDLISSMSRARLDMWFQLNGIKNPKNYARETFHKAIVQSSFACKTRGSYPKMTFHRDKKAEFTDQIYRQLFHKIDPRLEVAEEICKYLDL